VYNPVKIANFTSFKITEIKCGDEMSVFLNSNGDLFSCGWLSGIDQNFDSYLPTKIDVQSIKNISCGNTRIMILKNNGKLQIMSDPKH